MNSFANSVALRHRCQRIREMGKTSNRNGVRKCYVTWESKIENKKYFAIPVTPVVLR